MCECNIVLFFSVYNYYIIIIHEPSHCQQFILVLERLKCCKHFLVQSSFLFLIFQVAISEDIKLHQEMENDVLQLAT